MTRIDGDLVIAQDGRILGRLERWDLPVYRSWRCSGCGQLIPIKDWEVHQVACYTVGWGRYHSPMGRFTPMVTKARVKVDFVKELAHLLR